MRVSSLFANAMLAKRSSRADYPTNPIENHKIVWSADLLRKDDYRFVSLRSLSGIAETATNIGKV
jgi:hypothetical protein